MQEYFAQKMKDLQAKQNELKVNSQENNCSDIAGDCKQNDELIITKNNGDNRKRKKKRKKTKSQKYNLAQGQTFEDKYYNKQDKYDNATEKGMKNISEKQDAIEKENNADIEEVTEDDRHERKRKRKEKKQKLKDNKSKKKKRKRKEKE